MTSIPGVDYAWSHPGGAALQKAGMRFACRYLSHDSSKSLSDVEAADLAAHGVWSVVVWETVADRALSGYSGGASDARDALAQAKECGQPAGRPIYFAVDWDATPTQQDEINAYLDGAASVLGRDRVGIYGGYYPVKRALDAGKARWAWQTFAWSGGLWDSRAVIRQGGYITINGVECDKDTALAADYGQWMPGKLPEVAMSFTGTDLKTWAKTDNVIKSPDCLDPAVTNKFWTVESYLYETYHRVLEAKATAQAAADAVRQITTTGLTDAQITAIATKVADLLATRLAQ